MGGAGRDALLRHMDTKDEASVAVARRSCWRQCMYRVAVQYCNTCNMYREESRTKVAKTPNGKVRAKRRTSESSLTTVLSFYSDYAELLSAELLPHS